MQEKPFTILLVDDKHDNIVSLEAMLEHQNRAFLRAYSGIEALQLIKNNQSVGLIILDVQMPIMDGFEVARILKSEDTTKHIPIVFVSAINKDYKDVLTGFDTGGFEYLSKPLDVQITRAKVKAFEELYSYQQYLNYSIEQKTKINEQLKRFMHVVAHDLNSPLNAIIAILDILGQNEQLMEHKEFSDFLPLLTQSSMYLSDMIRSILTYSQTNAEQTIEVVDTHRLVSQIAYLLFPKPNVCFFIDSTLPTLRTSKIKLIQVFQNLISNALKYNDKSTGEIRIGWEDDGMFYKFYVKDNGRGINEEDFEEIFMLFRRLEKDDGGIGVGLNVVRVIVEEQGGKITLDSTPGAGATFYFQWLKQ